MADDPIPVCSQFQRSRGGDWPWCTECGWRWDYHDHPAGKRWAESRGLDR